MGLGRQGSDLLAFAVLPHPHCADVTTDSGPSSGRGLKGPNPEARNVRGKVEK